MHRYQFKHLLRVWFLPALLVLMWVGVAQAEVVGVSGNSFNLVAKADHITTGEGSRVLIWGFTDGQRAQYPGPTMIVNQGDTVTVTLTNTLSVATSIIFPGHKVTTTGGTPGLITQEAAAAGGTVTYRFVATNPGTYMYSSGTNPDLQVDMGLVGALIVRPSDLSQTAYGTGTGTDYDYEVLFLLTDMDPTYHDLVEFNRMAEINTNDFHPVFWFINGRNGPDTVLGNNVAWLPTQPYNCLPRIMPGKKILIRFVGGGRDPHPLHTHGNHFKLLARDGRLLSTTGATADIAVGDFTQTVNPGETYDAVFTWTGKAMGWDMYGHTAADNVTCTDSLNNETGANTPDGFDDTTYEWCADHEKPMPVTLPGINELTFSPFYSGSPYLGGGDFLPPGEGGFNQNGGYYYMWHSHSEKELTNNDIFPGGMLTFLIIEPPGTTGIK